MSQENIETSRGALGPPFYLNPAEASLAGSVGGRCRGRQNVPETPTDLEREKLSDSIIQVYYNFNAWRHDQGLTPIVDVFIVEAPREVKPTPPVMAIPSMKRSIRTIERLGLHNEKPEWEFTRANLVATVAFLEEEERIKAGLGPSPRSAFYPKVVGRPEPEEQVPPVAWADLQNIRAELFATFNSHIIPIDETKPSQIRRALQTYQDFTRLTSKAQIEKIFFDHYFPFREFLGRYLGVDLSEVDLKIDWDEVDQFWMMFEEITPTENRYWANWHRRNRRFWNEGRIDYYSKHEPMHAILPYFIRKEIEAGRLDKAAGVFPIPSPASFQMEGIAQTIDDFVNPPMTPYGKIAKLLYRLEKGALANGIFHIEAEGASIDSITEILSKFILNKRKEEIRQDLTEGLTDPFTRAFLGSIYGESDDLLRQFRNAANLRQRQRGLIFLLTTPLTPPQMVVSTTALLQEAA